MYADTDPDQTAHIHVQKRGHTDAHGDRKKTQKQRETKIRKKKQKKKRDADANKAVMHMLTQILIVIL